MSKPATVLQWCTSGPMTTPTGGKIAAGFSPAERGAAQYLNYLLNTAGLWTAWLNGLFDGSGNLSLDNNASVIVSGTGNYKRAAKITKVTPYAGVLIGNATYGLVNNVNFSTISSYAMIPLVMREGDRLTTVTCSVSCGATDVLQASVWKAKQNSQTQLGSTQSSTGHASAMETLTVPGLTEVVSGADIYDYFLQVQCTAFATGPHLWDAQFTTDVP